MLAAYKNSMFFYIRRIRIIGIAAVLKTAGRKPMGVRVPHPPRINWRGGRVAEGNGLLNRHSVLNAIGGSNPPLSAQGHHSSLSF